MECCSCYQGEENLNKQASKQGPRRKAFSNMNASMVIILLKQQHIYK